MKMAPLLVELARLTLRQPDEAVARLRALHLSRGDRWAVLALAATLSSLLAGGLGALFPLDPATTDPALAFSQALVSQPLTLALVQFLAMTVVAVLVHQVGGIFGGKGSFGDAVLVLGWIDLLVVGAELAQLLLSLLLPPLAPILAVGLVGLVIYLFVRMVGAIHGFRNPLLVGLGILGTMLAAGLVLGLLVDVEGLQRLMTAEAP